MKVTRRYISRYYARFKMAVAYMLVLVMISMPVLQMDVMATNEDAASTSTNEEVMTEEAANTVEAEYVEEAYVEPADIEPADIEPADDQTSDADGDINNTLPMAKSIETTDESYVTVRFMHEQQVVYEENVLSGSDMDAPVAPTLEDGEVFKGWKRAGDLDITKFPINITGEDEEVIIYNSVIAREYQVYFHGIDEGMPIVATKSGMTGDVIDTTDVTIVATLTDMEGLAGWSLTSGEDTLVGSSVTIATSDIHLYPIVKSGRWIIFHSTGGSAVNSVFLMQESVTVAPTNPIWEGYTFKHWSTQINGDAYTFGSTISSNVELYAVWEGRQSSYIVFHMRENANDDGYSYYEVETKYGIALSNTEATYKDYSAEGFSPQGTIIQAIIKEDNSTKIYVYYTRNIYQIKFNKFIYDPFDLDNGGWKVMEDMTITAKHGANILDRWPRIQYGYLLYRNGAGGFTPIEHIMPMGGRIFNMHEGSIITSPWNPHSNVGNLTYYYYREAKSWEPGAVKGGATALYPDRYYVLDESRTVRLVKIDNAGGWHTNYLDWWPMEGYTYDDYYRNAEFLERRSIYSHEKDEYYFACYYLMNEYTLSTFNNGDNYSNVKILYNTPLKGYKPEDPTRPEGIDSNTEFMGWYDNAEFEGEPYDFDTLMPAKDLKLHARWARQEVDVKVYDADRVTLLTTIRVQKGDSAKAGLDAVALGLDRFLCWKNMEDDRGYPAASVVMDNISVYSLVRDGAKYSVAYDTDDGAGGSLPVDNLRYLAGSTAIVKSAIGIVPPQGKKFVGWISNQDGKAYIAGMPMQMIGNVIMTAKWVDAVIGVKAKVEYHPGYATSTMPIIEEEYNNNTKIRLKGDRAFIRDGYALIGWSTEENQSDVEYNLAQKVLVNNSSLNKFYAVWATLPPPVTTVVPTVPTIPATPTIVPDVVIPNDVPEPNVVIPTDITPLVVAAQPAVVIPDEITPLAPAPIVTSREDEEQQDLIDKIEDGEVPLAPTPLEVPFILFNLIATLLGIIIYIVDWRKREKLTILSTILVFGMIVFFMLTQNFKYTVIRIFDTYSIIFAIILIVGIARYIVYAMSNKEEVQEEV